MDVGELLSFTVSGAIFYNLMEYCLHHIYFYSMC